MPAKKLYIDYSKCIGCESCEAICKFLYGAPRIQMSRTEDGRMFPLYCHHCDKPKCAEGCPEGVIAKESSGAVTVDRSAGRECDYEACALLCPFEAVFPGAGGMTITKCDLCQDRRENDMPPACVLMCPCEAIHYVTKEEEAQLKSEASKKATKEVMQHIKALKKARKEGDSQ